MKAAYWCFILVLVITCFSYATIIRVPGDYSTIQAGIDAAQHGDTVLVADGTYTGSGNKNLDFQSKIIEVRSENGPEHTIIDLEGDIIVNGFYFHSGDGPSVNRKSNTLPATWGKVKTTLSRIRPKRQR